MVEISTKTKNLEKLVESIILQSVLDLKTDFDSKATGTVLDQKLM